MKRLTTALFMALCITMVLPAGGRREAGGGDGKMTVVTTIFPPYDFVRAIAKDRVNLTMLLPPGAESHSFEPVPQDIIRIQNARVFIHIGGESEAWVERILESVDRRGKKILALMDVVDAVPEELVEGMEEDDDGGEEEEAYDEHVWTAPGNARLIAAAIRDLLCDADPANAAFYRENAGEFIAAIDELDAAFRDIVRGARRRTIVFGDRFPFRYFADAYGLSYFAAFPGCSNETEPQAATVAFLINKIRAERIPVVFHIEMGNERMAAVLAEATGAKVLLLHAGHNISRRDFENGVTWLETQRGNIPRLREALH